MEAEQPANRLLLISMLVMTAGTTAALPVSPQYVAHRGGGATTIAVFVGGPLVASTLVQIPAGRLADRHGRRALLAIALAAYALLSVPLTLSLGNVWQLCLARCTQGACVGGYHLALRVELSDRSAVERRAAAWSRLQAVTQLGFFAGPVLGGILGTITETAVFACGGAATLLCLVALTPVWMVKAASTSIPPRKPPHLPEEQRVATQVWRAPGFILCCAGLAANMLVLNAYDITWPQYMSARGFGTVVIGASIALYALPLALLSLWGATAIDRLHPRVLLGASFVAAGACAASYPSLHQLVIILLVNALEAAATVAIQPALYATIARSTPSGATGRALGIAGALESGGGAVGATALGAVYGISAALPFWMSGVILGGAGIACAIGLPNPARSAGAVLSLRRKVTGGDRTASSAVLVGRHWYHVATAAAAIEQFSLRTAGVSEWVAGAERVNAARGESRGGPWADDWEVYSEWHRRLVRVRVLEVECEFLRSHAEHRLRSACRAPAAGHSLGDRVRCTQLFQGVLWVPQGPAVMRRHGTCEAREGRVAEHR